MSKIRSHIIITHNNYIKHYFLTPNTANKTQRYHTEMLFYDTRKLNKMFI